MEPRYTSSRVREIWKELREVDGRCALALLYTAVSVTILEYGFYPARVQAWLEGVSILENPFDMRPASLEAGQIWAVGTIVANLVIPVAIVLLIHRESLSTIGFRLGGFLRHVWIYLLLYAGVMLPVLLIVADRPEFLHTYPFVDEAKEDLRAFLLWEAFYLPQFFALEAFFRGYLLFTLERKIGWLAIFVMVIPYGMIHFHKPPAECLGAIIAGVALGALALRYRSFYGGALLHALVAITMDSLAAREAGMF